MATIRIKNNDSIARIWCGQEVQPGEYYELENIEKPRWSNDDDVLTSITDGSLIVNNGTADISGLVKQFEYLEHEALLDPDGIPYMTNKVTDLDGRGVVHSTPRVIGHYTYYSGGDDDHTDLTKVGGSTNTTDCCHHHVVGNPASESKYLDFNTVKNQTYLHEGSIQWKDALNDHLTMEIVPQVTACSQSSGTYFNLYGGYLIIPAAGNGTVSVTPSDMKLVECVENEYGIKPAGYWNATFSTTTKAFENVTAAPNGDGAYNMFAAEVVLARFGNKIHLLGSGVVSMLSDDTTRLGQGMRIKMTSVTDGDDHEWWWNFNLSMYRKKTC